jgi:tetratricopeptide (TPR) repeat protein
MGIDKIDKIDKIDTIHTIDTIDKIRYLSIWIADIPSFSPTNFLGRMAAMRPSQPGPLTPEEFERVLRIKTDANQLFGAGESQRALDGWTAALQVYDGRLGSPEQRFEKGKLHSNKAEAALKLELYDVAVLFATESLECNPVDNKARFRRARALLGRGGFEDLMQAQEDVQTIKKNGGTLGAAEAALLRTAKGPLLPAAGAAKGTSGSQSANAPSVQAKTPTSTSGADTAREAAAAPATPAAPAAPATPAAPAAPAPPPGGFAANSPAEAVAAAVKYAETVSRAAKAAADVVNAAHAAADSAKAAADEARDTGARPGATHGAAVTATAAAAAAVAAAAAAGNGRSAGAKTYFWNTDTNETSEHRPAAAAAAAASLPGKDGSNEPCGEACIQGGNCPRCNPKPAPSPRREAVPDGPKGGGHPGWVALLPEPSLRHGWLVDVYRTRVDDDARLAMGTHPDQHTVTPNPYP